MSFLKNKDLDTMLKSAEVNYALVVPVNEYDKAVHDEGLKRARETIRLARIGLQIETTQSDLNDARNGWEAAVENVRELELQRDELLEGIRFISQTVHQVHHDGSITDCGKTTCLHARELIAKCGAK